MNELPESLYEKLVRCSHVADVAQRLRFYEKPKLWESMGVVFQEGYSGHDGKNVLLKVQPILRDVCSIEGIVPVERYELCSEGLVCDGQKYDISDKIERFRVDNAFREVKVLDYLAGQELGERYVQRLFCPEIGRDHELFFAGGDLYLRTLMEMKPGVCLGNRDGRFADEKEKDFGIIHPRDIVRCAGDLADDLLVLRYEKIFHNDVKRANVLREIGKPGESKFHLVDFGSARFDYELVDKRLMVGTDGYRAPEVMKGYGPNSYSDAWSLGALLYAEITGQLPFNSHYMEITSSMVNWAQERLYRSQIPFSYDFFDAVLVLLSDELRQRDLVKLRDLSFDLLKRSSVLRDVSDTTQRVGAVRGLNPKKEEFAKTAATPMALGGRQRRQEKVAQTFQEGEIDEAALSVRLEK